MYRIPKRFQEQSCCSDEDSVEKESVSLSQEVSSPKTNDGTAATNKNPTWNFFPKNKITGNSETTASCIYFSQISKTKIGQTTSLIRHLENKYPAKHAPWKNEVKERHSKTSLTSTAGCNLPKQVLMNMFVHSSGNHQYSIVCEPEFKQFINLAIPEYDLPGRNYFASTLIPSLYMNTKNQMTEVIKVDINTQSLASLCLTSDIWTSDANESFISVTLLYVNQDFTLRKFLLLNSYFRGSHDSVKIKEKIKSLMKEYDLLETKCFAHTTQLVISDAKFFTEGMDRLLTKCRAIVGHYKHSCQARERLNALQKLNDEKCLEVTQDVATRWNSEFLLLERLYTMKKSINAEFAANRCSDSPLIEEDWHLAESYIAQLQPLHQATKEVSLDTCCDLLIKFAIFLNIVGEDAVGIFNTFNLLDEARNDYKEVIKAFENYIRPTRNVPYERFLLYSRKQKEGEQFQQFITDLKTPVHSCELGDQVNDIVRDCVFIEKCANTTSNIRVGVWISNLGRSQSAATEVSSNYYTGYTSTREWNNHVCKYCGETQKGRGLALQKI
ncbi:hypothetical protein PR048_026780 [Dryococelus australis]|uniref:Uncharacterized protein n=1 Tax=Dryococelus australis TaxID=614101 RepID=A0ABQ9GMC7_9NEOP|nr:hypothetical protein PR048_026780 [Dryococelus australis]